MASNENPQPTIQTRDENEVSSVSSPTSAIHENVPAPATRDQLGEPVNGGAPPMPARTAGDPTTQPRSPAHQQPLPQPYPQYPSPYGPYAYQPQPYPCAQAVRVHPPYSKSWAANKLVLTVFSIIFAIIILALSCAFLDDDAGAEGMVLYALPITIAAILWNGAELITFGIRSRKDVKRGIHPGAHVALHLCFWLACAFAVLITASISLSVQAMIRDCADDETERYSYYSYSYCRRNDIELYRNGTYLPMIQAVLAFFCLATIDHFILFVIACIDTHKRNITRPAGVVLPPMLPAGGMYYPPPPPPGTTPYYPYPVAMQSLSQPPQQSQAGQVRFGPVPNGIGAVAPAAPQANPVGQNYQSLAGFYAPAPPQPSYLPAQPATGSNIEKVVPSTSAVPGQAS
ncbi:hypothetical protein F4813DRAFT_47791 [Daldinia decipiens]|uniref:uncharacterized protein n=1 Tax=Daldinia decipiens TaxID=326647 RepID=UPI0020C2908F|nr:uncharacterized protein F4813DRAFT_47791 [Daldinia decipiens]KAI1658400.1 hypothetical protein F4813DRAFT_47791 [Daldinia decipiens]